MDQEFAVGDVVQLKSGGPAMTIEYIGSFSMSNDRDVKAKCIWFEGKKHLENVFELATLMKISTTPFGASSRG
jgi:uncharacterized protein YodC (DUF2158 family)